MPIQAEQIIMMTEKPECTNKRSHQIVRTENENFQNDFTSIDEHKTSDTKLEVLIKCEECGKGFKTKFWFDKHVLSHALTKELQCELCGKTFKRNTTLKAHHREVHSQTKHYSCTKCSYETNNQTNYKTHSKIKHLHSSEESFKCDLCHKSYFRKEDLMRHNIKMHNAPRFECEFCDKSYTSEQYMRTHKLTHNPDFKMEHQCAECGKMFPNSGCLSSHMRKKHEGLVFRCEECGKEVASQTSLRDHMTQHSGIKQYKCFCGKQFATRKYLQIHSRTHTGEKPYSCSHCERTFTQRGSLTVHLQRYHISVKPHKCSVCFKEFVSSSLLKTHIKGHTSVPV